MGQNLQARAVGTVTDETAKPIGERVRLTIGYGQPPVLLFYLELVGEPGRLWVVTFVHLSCLVG